MYVHSPRLQQALPGGQWSRETPRHGGIKTCYGLFGQAFPWDELQQSQGPVGQDSSLGEATNGNGKQNEVQFALILRDKVHTLIMTYRLSLSSYLSTSEIFLYTSSFSMFHQ